MSDAASLLATRAGVDPAAMRDDVEVDDNTTVSGYKNTTPVRRRELRFRQTGRDPTSRRFYIPKRPAGHVDPSLWEDGVPGGPSVPLICERPGTAGAMAQRPIPLTWGYVTVLGT